jgi:tetratricopeptide (TPR) repeat protein
MMQNQTANEANNRDIEILQALASGQFAFGKVEVALDFLDLASILDVKNATTYVMMARIHYSVGDINEALVCIERATSFPDQALSERDQMFERRIQLLADISETEQNDRTK